MTTKNEKPLWPKLDAAGEARADARVKEMTTLTWLEKNGVWLKWVTFFLLLILGALFVTGNITIPGM